MKSKIKIAVIQTEIFITNKQQRLEEISRSIDKCAENNIDLICLPEYCTTQLNFLPDVIEMSDVYGEETPGATTNLFIEKAIKYGIYIIGGLIRIYNGYRYNTAIMIQPDGKIVHMQDKISLIKQEKKVLIEGDVIHVCNTELGKIGILMGTDINTFQLCKQLIYEDVEIVICLAQIPEEYSHTYKAILTARTIDMDAFIVVATTVGEINNGYYKMRFPGISRILRNPLLGDQADKTNFIISEADDCPTIIFGEINLNDFRNHRENAHRPNK